MRKQCTIPKQLLSIYVLFMSGISISTAADFRNTVINSSKPALVDFYADWCGPCKIMAPIIDQVASENPDIIVAKVDVDAAQELAAEYNISSIPTFLMFAGGKVVGQAVGAIAKAQLVKLVSEATKTTTQ